MSENFHRAVDDLDRGGPRNFQDAKERLLDEVRHGADARRLVDAVNRTEMEPGHAGAQIRLATDSQGYLDIAPANYASNQRPYDAPPQQYPQGPTAGEVAGTAAVAGTLGFIAGALLNRGHGRYEPRRPGW